MIMFGLISVMALIVVIETPFYLTDIDYDKSKIKWYTLDPVIIVRTFAVSMYSFSY